MKTMIKKKMAAGGTKKSAKKPCPPFCGESVKEKFSTKGSRIGLGTLAGMATGMAGAGIAKRLKGIKEEKDKAKKEGKTITRKEAKASYLNKVKSGPASSPETQKRGGSTGAKKMQEGGMTMDWPRKPKRASSGYKKGGKRKIDKSCRGKNCMNHG